MFAFLEAYFNEQKKEPSSTSSSSSSNSHGDYLNYGYLPARAGNLQAAVNLEIQDIDIGGYQHLLHLLLMKSTIIIILQLLCRLYQCEN